MHKIKCIAYKDLEEQFGSPGKVGEKLVSINLPVILKKPSNQLLKKVTLHEYIKKAFVDAWQEIYEVFGQDLENIGLNRWYEGYRLKKDPKNTDYWSGHAWGLAFSVNKAYGIDGRFPTLPYHFVQAFKARGFEWGGDWKKNRCGHYFTAIKEGAEKGYV